MNVSFISTMKGFAWGGSEELWSQTALRMIEKGHQVSASVHAWKAPAKQLNELQAKGCRIQQRRISKLRDSICRFFGNDPQFRSAIRFLKQNAPKLVVISCGGFADDPWWGRACESLKLKYVIVVHAVTECSWPSDRQARSIAHTYQHADKVYFVSDGNRLLVERMLGAQIENASVIRNPYNIDYNICCPFPSIANEIKVACVARLDAAAKGQDLLLEVLSLAQWRQRNIVVSFFGTGLNEETLKSLAQLRKLDRVRFLGHADSIADIWRTHHLLILPSRFEGLPLALVEAMICARPCVVTDVGGNAEIVMDNETGFLASAPTITHLNEAMERAWQRQLEWQAIGIEGSLRIRKFIPNDPLGIFVDEITRLC